eukprot:6361855-Karenia_brevis.AAC.1
MESTHVLLPWIVEYAGEIVTRCRKGDDGRTAYERLRGKAPSCRMMPVGEKVLFMPLKDSRDRKNNLEP